MIKESTSSQNSLTFTCIICGQEKELVCVGECNHRGVCSYCAMKSRLHYDYKKCPICLKILDIIFIVDIIDKTPYKALISKKDEFFEDEEFEKCQIYYTTMEGKEEALNLRGFNCPIKNCHSESFENLNSLSEHLNETHQRFYCKHCLKENKLFLSQMSIYNQKNLDEHIHYGEYDKNNNLISPPHPTCKFDKSTFYNEEQLFKHMNEHHFICQICKNKKNIIFYPKLENLLAHYKDNHYCCPFQECIADVYVVFSKEEELISHLITKHKIQDANERMNQLIFDRKDSNKKLQHEKGEFNFTQYIKKLKEESENYKNNNQDRFINEQHFNDGGIYKYENNKRNYNNYGYNRNNKYKNNFYRERGGKYNRRDNRNYYYIDNNHGNRYYKNNYYGNSDYMKEENNTGKYYKNKEGDSKFKKIIDYSILFTFYLNLIKEYITNKIITEKIEEKQVSLPKETIYQIIIMIDKFDSNDKLLELVYLNNFGIDLEIHKTLKSLISEKTQENEKNFKELLVNLELKKLLIIYKYLYVCSKKVDNLFYKFDLDQIEEDLYEDFCQKIKKDDIIMNKEEKERRNRQAYLKAELNLGYKVLPEDKKINDINYKKKEEKNEDKKENNQPENKPKTKINMLLNNEIIEKGENDINHIQEKKGKRKKGKGQFIEFNIHDYKKFLKVK